MLWRSKDGYEAIIKGCGGYSVVKSDGANFLAQHTVLQVCYHMAAVLEMGTTILAW